MPKRIKLTKKEVQDRCISSGFLLLSRYKNANSYIRVKCRCGKIINILAKNIFNKSQKSCGCYKHSSQFLGMQDISGSYWSRVKNGASNRKISFNITIEQAWNLFIKQNKKCALSGVDLTLEPDWKKYNKNSKLQTASLDRINSKRGYIKGNVRWVHKDVNYLRHKYMNDFTDIELINWCRLIYFNNLGNNNGTN